jgi:hypothetical protein
MTFPEDGPASGKFTKTFTKPDYVIKFMNTFVNGLLSCDNIKTVISTISTAVCI